MKIASVVVTGGRSFPEEDGDRIRQDLRTLSALGLERVAHGWAAGADRIARLWAEDFLGSAGTRGYPADWRRDGRAAGPRRNVRMLEAERPDLVLAYPIRDSRGTWNCVTEALARGITVAVWAPWMTHAAALSAATSGGRKSACCFDDEPRFVLAPEGVERGLHTVSIAKLLRGAA